jgi:hypothetical protein
MALGEGALMGTAVDYAQRAAECRRLATQYTKPEHWEHFLENGRDLGDAAEASTGKVALANNRACRPVSERSLSLR